jgi:hypothetical protein
VQNRIAGERGADERACVACAKRGIDDRQEIASKVSL